MGDGAITFLLENLTRLLSQEADLLHGVEEEVRSLQTELKLIEPRLRDYGQKHNEPDIKTEFINQLRDAAREAEDIIDPYVASVAQQRRGNFLVRTKNRLQWLSSRQRVAKQIQGIKKRFENLFRQKDKYEIQISQQADLIPVETNSPMRRRLVEETDVVGLDDVARDITERLTEGEARRVVIPIVGMGGIGKTTLARKVYNDPVVVKHFDFRAWVFVSQAHDARNLLQALLKSAVGMLMEEMKDMSNEDLGYELRRYLTSAKYMIILDDVSKPDCWDELNQVFANNNYGSRIIITTQDDSVARHVNEKPLKLHFLSEEKSWELFSKKVFLVERCPTDLEDLGKQMAEKCKGLPLAIVVLAGVLLKKEKTRWWWSKVSLDVSSILTEQTDHCIKILQLSYDNLPNHLKTCFLYFGLFPNNFEISARKLVRLWIAEGFVQKKDNETMEEVAEEYLGDLIARNVVQVSETYVDGTVKACCVHNILHKICIFKAKEEKFLEVCAFGSSYTLLSNLRRVGLHSSMLNYISSNPASSTLRSMLCFGPEERPLSLEAWKLLYKRFPLLRVLDAGIVGVEVIPNDIHKLLHLRYLTLKSPSAQTLPASISNLWNLQTLVVAAPNIDRPQLSIWKMKELRHLRFRGQLLLSEPPQENDSDNVSINLQTLYCISPDSCTERVFSMLPNLLKLGIQGNLEEHRLSGKFQNFSKLNRLLTLKLERDRSCKKLDSLRYVEFPSNLNKLTLVETQLLEDPMDILGQLLNLRVLILKNAAYNGRKLNCRSNGFPKLEAFHLVNLAIRSWTISQGSMARLRSVVINRCGRLEGLPSALQNMPAFQEMELSNHVQLVNQAREIEKSRGKKHFKLVICSLKIN